MKRLVLIMALVFAVALALPAAAKKPNVQHFDAKFNIIGHPMKNKSDVLSNDQSNGKAIFVPLKNANRQDLYCDVDDIAIVNDTEPTFTNMEPAGAKIHFYWDPMNPTFEIEDRDATDGDAVIRVPEPGTWDIYLRALGKPNQCMNINAWAYDFDQNLWFWAGRAEISRKVGKNNNNTDWTSTRDLFDVWFCNVEMGACADDPVELSVFDNTFEDYFWAVLNDGQRIVQARLVLVDD